MKVQKGSGRAGDFAMISSPKFELTQTGCLEVGYNISKYDELDLFLTKGKNALYRQHLCTLPGIDHLYYAEGLPQK